jgi:catechol 2,3-dioxygenase-like lactoylglutathione lyase family enzyme
MLERFSHVMLYVYDLDRAVKWYCDKLGFTERYVAPQAFASLWHQRMDCRLDLHPTGGRADITHGPMPYFATLDLDATLAELRKKGVEIGDLQEEGEENHIVRFASFFDSEGNVLGIEEQRT